jgi:hypothetical protein
MMLECQVFFVKHRLVMPVKKYCTLSNFCIVQEQFPAFPLANVRVIVAGICVTTMNMLNISTYTAIVRQQQLSKQQCNGYCYATYHAFNNGREVNCVFWRSMLRGFKWRIFSWSAVYVEFTVRSLSSFCEEIAILSGLDSF